MPNAILDPDVLIDDLVGPVIDALREDLHPQFGVRAYRVFTVKRRWAGELAGEGAMVEEIETEIRPQPLVAPWDGLRYTVGSCGMMVDGKVRLTEVSLTLTEAELTGKGPGGKLATNEMWFLKLTDAHGQQTTPMYFTLDGPPYIDRVKTLGWIVNLTKVDVE